jgi:hypothetical protein
VRHCLARVRPADAGHDAIKDMQPIWGAHSAVPHLGIEVEEFAANQSLQRKRDFLFVTSEAIRGFCSNVRHLNFVIDITEESKPMGIANFQVPEASGNYCARGGSFGPHAINENPTPIYYGRLIFLSYFNAGTRVWDIRDPYDPKEVAYFVPKKTDKTRETCRMIDNVNKCATVPATNNVEVDDRGYIYSADRANTGMHIMELTGQGRSIARFPNM